MAFPPHVAANHKNDLGKSVEILQVEILLMNNIF